MADIDRYKKALINADKAGDVDAARKLAAKIREMQSEEGGDFSFTEMVKNIPSSGVQFGKDMATPFLHPIDTAQSVYNLALGVASKAIPGEQESEVYADQVGQFIKDRYGSWDAFKKTAEDDPVGVLADVSALFTGGATGVAKAGGRVGRLGKTLQNVGKAIDPVNATAKTAAYGAGKLVPKGLPRGLYKSAAKFGTSAKTDVDKIADTAVREGLMPTDRGVGKLVRIKKQLQGAIDKIVDEATETGATIPVDDVLRNMDQLKADLGGFKMKAPRDLARLDKYIDEFKEYLTKNDIKEVTPRQLQDFKVDAHQRLNYDKSMFQGNYVDDRMQQNMASAARQRLEDINPDIGPINKRYGNLLELEDKLEGAAKRISGNNFLNIDVPLKTAAGAATSGPAGAVSGGALSVLEMPRVKARTALILEALRNRDASSLTRNRTAPLMGRQALMYGGRAQQAQEENPIPELLRAR